MLATCCCNASFHRAPLAAPHIEGSLSIPIGTGTVSGFTADAGGDYFYRTFYRNGLRCFCGFLECRDEGLRGRCRSRLDYASYRHLPGDGNVNSLLEHTELKFVRRFQTHIASVGHLRHRAVERRRQSARIDLTAFHVADL